jgi:hypothetical protein
MLIIAVVMKDRVSYSLTSSLDSLLKNSGVGEVEPYDE